MSDGISWLRRETPCGKVGSTVLWTGVLGGWIRKRKAGRQLSTRVQCSLLPDWQCNGTCCFQLLLPSLPWWTVFLLKHWARINPSFLKMISLGTLSQQQEYIVNTLPKRVDLIWGAAGEITPSSTVRRSGRFSRKHTVCGSTALFSWASRASRKPCRNLRKG